VAGIISACLPLTRGFYVFSGGHSAQRPRRCNPDAYLDQVCVSANARSFCIAPLEETQTRFRLRRRWASVCVAAGDALISHDGVYVCARSLAPDDSRRLACTPNLRRSDRLTASQLTESRTHAFVYVRTYACASTYVCIKKRRQCRVEAWPALHMHVANGRKKAKLHATCRIWGGFSTLPIDTKRHYSAFLSYNLNYSIFI
jgi:hypothetical protein